MTKPLTDDVLEEIRARARFAGEGANAAQTLHLLDEHAALKRTLARAAGMPVEEALAIWGEDSGDDDILGACERVRSELADAGVKVRASEWLADAEEETKG